ncbi:MAG: prepilin-type N-terminal cleavage/methylation domain-containing protein [Gammaproteobacteria bacterium]|nr:prepilin-type N-terminal cleavage/methylation domain-containing protein [Gammaproteobacteria bacterium]
MNKITSQQGFSLVEMMIAITLASLITIMALSMYFIQDRNIGIEEKRSGNITLSETSYSSLSRLLRHALSNTVTINYGNGRLNTANNDSPEISSDEMTVDFSLPPNYPIWPNDKLPYDKPWVRLHWSNRPQADAPYSITIATAANPADLANATPGKLTPDEGENLIANLDFWPLDANGNVQASPQAAAPGGYLLSVTSRTTIPDQNYQHPRLAQNNPLAQFRTHSLQGVVSPRN